MDQNIKQQIVESINGTTNVLVTVSSNPTVDELAACIGLTLVLNKLGKHATAVFSGKVPSTIEFLKPDETLETNTDSLRDFIIALDKSKADKLRYKVEDSVVKIFITPYKTSIGQKDLEFSQGDFNVDVVLALGVHTREELDRAITAHGRILHDATVICVNHDQVSNLGVYNWQDAQASSLCEMVVDLSETLQPDNFDAQTATALLTGIVAETARFSNDKTSPRTMSLAAKLMAAGANQQLVASKLQTDLDKSQVAMKSEEEVADETDDDGTLHIAHSGKKDEEDELVDLTPDDNNEEDFLQPKGEPVEEEPLEKPEEPRHEKRVEPDEGALEPEAEQPTLPEVSATEEATEPSEQPTSSISDVKSLEENAPKAPQLPNEPVMKPSNSKISYEPPMMGGTLTANSRPEPLEPPTDGLSLPSPVNAPILNHNTPKVGQSQPEPESTPAPQPQPNPLDDFDPNKPLIDEETVSHIEKSVGSDHVQADTPQANLDELRNAVDDATRSADDNRLEPLASAGSTPLDMNVQDHASSTTPPPLPQPPVGSVPSASDIMGSVAQTDNLSPMTQPQMAQPDLPTQLVPPEQGLPPEQTASSTPQPLGPPPPVPPPMPMPPVNGFPTQPPAGPQPPQPPYPPAPGQ